jgi:lipase
LAWHHRQVTGDLHVHRFGPPGPVQLLALHGLTGHGRRWGHLAGYVPEIAIAAPDLIGHGRSSWAAPWTIDANIAALGALLTEQADGPVLVVGHSFGGGLAMHLAATRPDRVAALLLLDPAVGLDGSWTRYIAEAMLSSPDYPDRAEARQEKAGGSWADVDPAVLDADLDEHLVELPNGRYGWRVSLPAMMSYWSELARDVVLPPAGTATTLVHATRTSPPYVSDRLIAGLRERLGHEFELLHYECDHMVADAKPTEVAALIRKLIRAA